MQEQQSHLKRKLGKEHAILHFPVVMAFLLVGIMPHTTNGVRIDEISDAGYEVALPAGALASEWEKQHCTRMTLTSPLVCKCEGLVFTKHVTNLRLNMSATLEGAVMAATQDTGNLQEALKDIDIGLLKEKKDINPALVTKITWQVVKYTLKAAGEVMKMFYPGVAADVLGVVSSGMGGVQSMFILSVLEKIVKLERETTEYAFQANRVATAMVHKAECMSGHLAPQLQGFEKGTLRLSALANNICETTETREKLKSNINKALAGIKIALETMRGIGACLYPLGSRVEEKGLCVEKMYHDFSLGGDRGLGVLLQFTNLLVLHTKLMDELTQSKTSIGTWQDGPGYYTASLLTRTYGTGYSSPLNALPEGDAIDRKIECANLLVVQASYAYMFQAMSRAMEIWVRSQAREYWINPVSQHAHMLTKGGVKLRPCRSVFKKYGAAGHFCKVPAPIPIDANLRATCSVAAKSILLMNSRKAT